MSESTVGKVVESMFKLRAEKDELNGRIKEINRALEELEYKAVRLMDEQGITSLRVPDGTATRKVELYPKIEDRERFLEFCYANGRTDLMVVTANRGTFKEFYEQYNEYPEGLDAYEKNSISFRRSR